MLGVWRASRLRRRRRTCQGLSLSLQCGSVAGTNLQLYVDPIQILVLVLLLVLMLMPMQALMLMLMLMLIRCGGGQTSAWTHWLPSRGRTR